MYYMYIYIYCFGPFLGPTTVGFRQKWLTHFLGPLDRSETRDLDPNVQRLLFRQNLPFLFDVQRSKPPFIVDFHGFPQIFQLDFPCLILPFTSFYMVTWSFPKMLPLKHPFEQGISMINKKTFLGTPMTMETHYHRWLTIIHHILTTY